jgi:aldose 1-epimerase
MRHLKLLVLSLCLLSACQTAEPESSPQNRPSMPTISKATWGESPYGTASLYTLTNGAGHRVVISDWGGIIQSIIFQETEMTVGYETLEKHLGPNPYFGALVGRYGNRIGGATFELEGKTFELEPNGNGNQLHGGPEGFDKRLWEAATTTTDSSAILTLSLISPDGDQGFPGTLTVSCQYEWTNDNALRLQYTATTDKTTIVNLTNHTYFNLAGSGTILDHTLRLDGDFYTPVNPNMIPTGELAPVKGTPFDFTKAKAIGQDIKTPHPQLEIPNGYDHNWAINNYDGSLREFALLEDPASGRKMRCFTTEPGVQIWTTNFPTGQFTVRPNTPIPTHAAICLETQHFPDSPNQDNFTTPVLKPGETYRTTTVYRFE